MARCVREAPSPIGNREEIFTSYRYDANDPGSVAGYKAFLEELEGKSRRYGGQVVISEKPGDIGGVSGSGLGLIQPMKTPPGK